jgi:hypothetical protein
MNAYRYDRIGMHLIFCKITFYMILLCLPFKGSPNGTSRMVSIALISAPCKQNDDVAVELKEREGNRFS